jgi:hypothetical protein
MVSLDLSKSLSLKDFSWKIVQLSQSAGLDIGYNSIICAIMCPDSQATTVLLRIREEVGKKEKVKILPKKIRYDLIYERRVFGGIFLPDFSYHSLEPAVFQIPDSGLEKKGLSVIQLAHIGYDQNLGFGKFIRYGRKEYTLSCGAVSSIFYDEFIPQDADLKILKNYIDSMKSPGDDILSITYKLIEESSKHTISELKKLAEKHKISVVFLSGIEIDVSKPKRTILHNDKIFLIKEEIINSGQ